jgi:allatostatin receptor
MLADAAPQIMFFATSYVTPLALICGLYLCMLLRLWRGVAPGGHVSAESRRGKKRVTRMVVVVVAIFAICWFPIQVGLLVKTEVKPQNFKYFNVFFLFCSVS